MTRELSRSWIQFETLRPSLVFSNALSFLISDELSRPSLVSVETGLTVAGSEGPGPGDHASRGLKPQGSGRGWQCRIDFRIFFSSIRVHAMHRRSIIRVKFYRRHRRAGEPARPRAASQCGGGGGSAARRATVVTVTPTHSHRCPSYAGAGVQEP